MSQTPLLPNRLYEHQVFCDGIDCLSWRNKCQVFFVFESISENYKTLNRSNESTAWDLNDLIILDSDTEVSVEYIYRTIHLLQGVYCNWYLYNYSTAGVQWSK